MMRCPDGVGMDWKTAPNGTYTIDAAGVEVMMDIRQELRELNRMLRCQSVQDIPRMLAAIKRNTTKPKKAKP
jgi:hypothetical protein